MRSEEQGREKRKESKIHCRRPSITINVVSGEQEHCQETKRAIVVLFSVGFVSRELQIFPSDSKHPGDMPASGGPRLTMALSSNFSSNFVESSCIGANPFRWSRT